MTSSDGINWTGQIAPANDWTSVTYGIVNGVGLFVAVSYQGTNQVMTSLDGTAWTAHSAAGDDSSIDNLWFSVTHGIVNGVGLFVAVAVASTGDDATNDRVMTSPNGIDWTFGISDTDNEWFSVTYGNGVFVAVSTTIETDHQVMTSGSIMAQPAFTFSSSTESRTVNTAATGFTTNSTGGTIAFFSIDATPPGMSFNTTTGALTGTPSTVAPATTYTITATNASGIATQTFTLTVTAAIVADNSAALAAIEAARLAAIAEAARQAAAAKQQRELTEILSIIPSLGALALSLGETTKSLTLQKCVKKKQVRYVKKGAKCPKGFVRKR
jgi:hypothetical protein